MVGQNYYLDKALQGIIDAKKCLNVYLVQKREKGER